MYCTVMQISKTMIWNERAQNTRVFSQKVKPWAYLQRMDQWLNQLISSEYFLFTSCSQTEVKRVHDKLPSMARSMTLEIYTINKKYIQIMLFKLLLSKFFQHYFCFTFLTIRYTAFLLWQNEMWIGNILLKYPGSVLKCILVHKPQF